MTALAGVFLAFSMSLLLAFDAVATKKGKPPTKGKVTEITKEVVKVEVNTVVQEIPVNEVRDIQYEEDTLDIKTARVLMRNGEFDEALQKLNAINVAELPRDPFMKDDVDFYKAVCTARLALGGAGDKTAAAKIVGGFLSTHPNSYHYYDAVELFGDMQVSLSDFPKASTAYGVLAKAPWPEYKLRATVLEGRALQGQPGKAADALTKFESVLADSASGPLADEQKLHASLGKAVAMAQTGKPADGIKILEGIIEKGNPQTDSLLFARAYNAMGACYRADKDNKEAVKNAQLAYLHVDLLFSQDPEQHAEALYYLVQLWNAANYPERADRCKSILNEKYAGSRWAPKGM